MTKAERKRHAAEWVKPILTRFFAKTGDKDRTTALGGAVALIAGELPPEAFCPASAEWVLAQADIEHFTGASLTQTLDAWWRENAPPKPHELPRDIEQSPLDGIGKRWAFYFRKRTQDGERSPRLGAVLLLVRSQSPAAFEWLMEHDDEALAVARASRIRHDPNFQQTMREEWGDPAMVRRAIGSCMGDHEHGGQTWPTREQRRVAFGALRGLVRQWAPQNLGLVDEGERDAEGPAPEVPLDAMAGGIFGPPPGPQAPRAGAVGALGETSDVRRPSASHLGPEALADAYGRVGTGPADFRADQLRKKGE